jgi:hypothetical protein
LNLTVLMVLLTAATVLDGLLAGLNVDRALVQMPAWRKVGVRGWAAYSRHGDLGNGRFLYPFLAIAGTILALAAAITLSFSAGAPPAARLPLYLSAALGVAGLALTAVAGPFMLSLKRIGDDAAALQRAFDGFERWGGLRGVFQVLAFGANVWALVAVLRGVA